MHVSDFMPLFPFSFQLPLVIQFFRFKLAPLMIASPLGGGWILFFNIYNIFYDVSLNRHLGYFHTAAIVSMATINMEREHP